VCSVRTVLTHIACLREFNHRFRNNPLPFRTAVVSVTVRALMKTCSVDGCGVFGAGEWATLGFSALVVRACLLKYKGIRINRFRSPLESAFFANAT